MLITQLQKLESGYLSWHSQHLLAPENPGSPNINDYYYLRTTDFHKVDSSSVMSGLLPTSQLPDRLYEGDWTCVAFSPASSGQRCLQDLYILVWIIGANEHLGKRPIV